MKIIELLESIYNEHTHIAIFLAGGPGSGKSYVADIFTTLKIINIDKIFEWKMKKAERPLTPENIASKEAQEIRNNAGELKTKSLDMYKQNRLGLLIDGTGRNPIYILDVKEKLEHLHYRCAMVYVHCDYDMAKERNEKRVRSLPMKIFDELHKQVNDGLPALREIFGNAFYTIDNSTNDPQISRNRLRKLTNDMNNFMRKPASIDAQMWLMHQTK